MIQRQKMGKERTKNTQPGIYTSDSSDFCRDTVPLGSCSDQCIFFFIFTKCKRRYAICPGQYKRADPKPHPVYFTMAQFLSVIIHYWKHFKK